MSLHTCECIKFTTIRDGRVQSTVACGNPAFEKVTHKDMTLWVCDPCKVHNQFMYNTVYKAGQHLGKGTKVPNEPTYL
jgi:hypothetical protein